MVPAFVAALALQHLAELVSSFFDWRKGSARSGKKLLIGTATAVLAGWALTFSNVGILNGVVPHSIDVVLSALFVSAVAGAFHSILKLAAPATTTTEPVTEFDPAASLSLPQPRFP